MGAVRTSSPGSLPPLGAPPGRSRLTRSPDDRLVGGVAGGLAHHLGLDPLVIRLAFVGLTVAGGVGVLLYGLFWVLVPEGDPTGGAHRADRRSLWAFVALGVGGLLLLSELGFGVGPRVVAPLVIAGVGVALVWRQADEAQRDRWRRVAGPGSRWRIPLGVGLVVAGAGGLVAVSGRLTGGVGHAFLAGGIVLAGVVLVLGPWLLGLVRALGYERRERIRSQERADMAAHLHDSVLQTLAMIQRQAGVPREVVHLARGQERDLRAWLYGAPAAPDASLRTALERVAAEVEDDHGMAIDVVVVGDGPLDEPLQALLRAAREAMVNAAKHSGAASVDVYGEVEGERVVVFVRDRGKGFDPDLVPGDRLGIERSIVERMARHGGTASVRSAVGEGTDVRLEMRR
ncbi:MAG: ATP-binding protein [Acidimicrobiales bacterium]